MKHRIWALLFALVLALSLTACGEAPSDGEKSNDQTAQTETGGNEAQSGEADAEEPAAEGAGDLGDFHVEVKGAALSTDYNGNPAIVINYAWTNNSEETTSAMVSLLEKAFQDGVELETAIIDDSNYNAEATSKDIRPGTTLDVQCAFVLSSETSPVEFELSEVFSFSSDKVTMDFDPAGLS